MSNDARIIKAKKEVLTKFIIPTYEKYKDTDMYDICLYKNLIRVRYNHNFYYIDIIVDNNELYWKLMPYKKSFYTTIINDNSFERVLFAITEAKS